MKRTTTDVEPTLKTKMQHVKQAVRELLLQQGYGPLSTKALKEKASIEGWVAPEYDDFRRKQTWLDVYHELTMAGKVVRLVSRKRVKQAATSLVVRELVRNLLWEYDGYAPIPEFRRRLPELSKKQQEQELYKLENEGIIELSSLQETRLHLHELHLGIKQAESDDLFPPPLFYIVAA